MMRKWMTATAGLLCSAMLLFSACSKEENKGGNNTDNYDRKAMLTNYADNYVVPAYNALQQRLASLQTAAAAFTTNPDAASLLSLQNSWADACRSWQKADLLEFGPAEAASLRMYLNTYPVTISKVNGNIASGVYNLEEFGNKDAQGFAALDYLLNGLAASSADILIYYTTDPQAAARRKYLNDVVTFMKTKVDGINSEWNGSYRNTFINSTGTDVSSSTSRMVNAFVLYYERYLRSGKIGLPVGAMTGTAAPQLTEAYYKADLSKELAQIAFESVEAFYQGKSYDGSADGPGMYDYLKALGTKDNNGTLMADVIVAEMGQAHTGIQGLGNNIRTAVQNNRPAVLVVYQELQDVVPLLKVDMVSAFGISITYVDNDGD